MARALGTRDSIMHSAQYLFAVQGFDATTVKAIATKAGVNPALLYYYFADKETLYRETLRHSFRHLIDEAVKRLDPTLPPDVSIRRFVQGQITFLAEHPHIPKLLIRELVDHPAEHAEEHIAVILSTGFRHLCDVIARGQAMRLFRKEIDPAFAAICTISMVAHFFTARPAIGILLGDGIAGPSRDKIDAYGRHAADFALAALVVNESSASSRTSEARR